MGKKESWYNKGTGLIWYAGNGDKKGLCPFCENISLATPVFASSLPTNNNCFDT